MNPVLAREVKERFRGRRAGWWITLWVIAMGSLFYTVYLIAQNSVRQFGLGRLVATGYIGQYMFQAVSLLMVTAVVMVVPGMTALAVVAEREKQTLALLQVSQLTAFQLVKGKLASSLAYFLLILVLLSPVLAVPLLFGGMTVGDVLGALGMLVVIAATVGSISVWVSARARSSRGAVTGSYLWSFILAFFTLVLMVLEIFLGRPAGGGQIGTTAFFGPGGREIYSTWANPYFAMVDAVDHPLSIQQGFGQRIYGPFEAVLYRRHGVRVSTQGFIEGVPPGGFEIVNGEQRVVLSRGALWIRSLIVFALIIAVSLARATRALRAPAPRRRRWRKVQHAPA